MSRLNIMESEAVRYALRASGETEGKVPKYVKKQCAAWLDIVSGRNSEACIDEKTFGKICRLLKLIVHPDLHKPLFCCMESYAWLLITAVFCTRYAVDDTRYYRTALLEICRKNYKTFYAGVIFIIGMLTGDNFSRYFSVAPDLKLSKELQIALRKLIKSSPALNDGTIFKTLRNEVRCLVTDSDYIPLAYSEDNMDGKTANIFLADEAGNMDAYPIEAMRSSQLVLRDKLGIIISTQYPNGSNGFQVELDLSKRTLDGFDGDKRRFSLLYEPDGELLQNDGWKTDDRVLYQANPVAVSSPYIFEELTQKRRIAVLYEDKRENFLCKHCNIQYKGLGTEGYVDIMQVRKCRIKEEPDFWRGRRVWLGLDLSQTDDNTSVAMAAYDGGKIYAKVWGFIPADSVELKSDREKVNYRQLIREGCCFACGDSVINYGDVEDFILSLPEKYGVDIIQLGFDPYNAISTVNKLESAEEPIECVKIKQHSSLLHRPTKFLKEAILSGNFRYGDNTLLEMNFENARCTEDTNLNKYVNKKKSAGKVDGVVALINALYLLQLEIESPSGWGAQVF